MAIERSNEDLIKDIKAGKNVQDNMYQLYTQNLTLIKRWCNKYISTFGANDVLQECYIALHNAVQTFEIEKEYKFTTYLQIAIKTYLSKAFANGKGVKLGADDKRLLMEYNALNERSQQATGKPISDYNACCKLNCTKEQIERIRQFIRLNNCLSLDKPIGEDDDTTLADTITLASDDNIELAIENKENAAGKELWKLVNGLLNERSAAIITERYKAGKSQTEIAEILKLSHGRIGAIEHEALRKLRTNEQFKQFAKENYAYDLAYKNNGFTSWKYNGASSVELAVEKADQRRQRKYDVIRAEAEKDIDEWYEALLAQIQSDT